MPSVSAGTLLSCGHFCCRGGIVCRLGGILLEDGLRFYKKFRLCYDKADLRSELLQTPEMKGIIALNKGIIYIGRAAWFLLRTILIVLLCLSVFYVAFATAMSYGSIYVISTEGIELRADAVLGAVNRDELTNYFTEQWLETDSMLLASPYENYKVTSYNYSMRIESMRVWGWSDTGTVQVTERITGLTGTATDGAVDENGQPAAAPAWVDCRYELTMQKEEGGVWKIGEVRVLEELPKPTPAMPETEDEPALTPAPEAAPAPVPTPPGE